MKVQALNAVKFDGKKYTAGDVFNADKKSAETLMALGAVKPYAKEEAKAKEEPVYDGEDLFENTEDLSTLKVDELKAICAFLDIPHTGTKAELIEAINGVSEIEES